MGLRRLAEAISRVLLDTDMQGKKVLLTIEQEESLPISLSRTFSKPFQNCASVLYALRMVLRQAKLEENVTALRVVTPDLARANRSQIDLFNPHINRQQAVAETFLAHVRGLYGQESVRLASEIPEARRTKVLRAWRDALGWYG